MSINGVLDKIKAINTSNVISVRIPSTGDDISFNPLTIKQQKDLVKTALDGNASVLSLNTAINDILIQNSVKPVEFLVTDKIPVILALRVQSFGEKYTQDDVELDVNHILSKKLDISLDSEEYMIGNKVLQVEVGVPSIKKETQINKYALDMHNKSKEENVATFVGNLFVYEIIKFVKTLKVNGDDVKFDELSVWDRYQLIENLPVTLNNDILEYINKVRKLESAYMTVDDVTLSVDARFFSK